MQKSIKLILSKKISFISIGIINLLVFHFAIYRLWFFLYDSSGRVTTDSIWVPISINTILLAFFCIPHSLLLNSSYKIRFLKYIPNKLYSTLYSLHASMAIILIDLFWVQVGPPLFDLGHIGDSVVTTLYTASWLFMLWSMVATGLFRQSGIEEWWKALRKRKMKYGLLTDGPYNLCRHPIYAAFIGMIWFTPNVTIDRLYLSLAWTLYIFIGAALKEKRLRRNKLYQNYSKQVPAFPFLPKKWDHYLTYSLWRQS